MDTEYLKGHFSRGSRVCPHHTIKLFEYGKKCVCERKDRNCNKELCPLLHEGEEDTPS
jgi:hypothetical protein